MRLIQVILILLVQFYRWFVSPAKFFVFGPNGRCRFTPSCSEYALAALRAHGAVRGSWFSVKRVCRCHPWGSCGYDPVPATDGCASRALRAMNASVTSLERSPSARQPIRPLRFFPN